MNAVESALLEIRDSFRSDAEFFARKKRILERWPRVSDEEYLEIIPSIWIQDLWDQKMLCTMPYREFLRTVYWRAISKQKKKEHPWCDRCYEYLQQLHVHHKTYVRRGLEWLFPEDLEVLCHACHKEEHSKTRGDEWAA